ncbi:hypothetical protein [Herbaspirillum robiniae]|uniref:Uncharacterized protein n=1 Tax=Herbaspirillum robiniae TaxID=2014887 RepID=A0A246WM50_9BURK|nr:hypothetical protein [Herbaspirillum robiniae]OWY27051.1 hypothetical protein CEJ42_20705 [Herbaspirillum robiniae]
MKKLKYGDVVEIKTKNGLAYAQYTHKHKQFGALLRVFSNIYTSRPGNLPELIKLEPTFICFSPLGAAVNRGIVSIVDCAAVPLEAQAFPTFRAGIINPSTKKVDVWWLWDGETEWRVGEIDAEQRKLPIRGVWNDTLLIERIESGWMSNTDPR